MLLKTFNEVITTDQSKNALQDSIANLKDITDSVKLICLDLDDCFTPDGKIEPLTKEFLKEFSEDEYEVSSSGEGIHIYVLTKLSLETFIVKEIANRRIP